MWSSADISIVIEEDDLPTVLARITTPLGTTSLLAELRRAGDTLHIEKAHIDGLTPNALGMAGLNAIGLMEEANVARIVVEGAARTTGRGAGRIPCIIRFPRGQADQAWFSIEGREAFSS